MQHISESVPLYAVVFSSFSLASSRQLCAEVLQAQHSACWG